MQNSLLYLSRFLCNWFDTNLNTFFLNPIDAFLFFLKLDTFRFTSSYMKPSFFIIPYLIITIIILLHIFPFIIKSQTQYPILTHQS